MNKIIECVRGFVLQKINTKAEQLRVSNETFPDMNLRDASNVIYSQRDLEKMKRGEKPTGYPLHPNV